MLRGQGLEGPEDEDLRRVIDKMDASAAATAANDVAAGNENKPTNITPI